MNIIDKLKFQLYSGFSRRLLLKYKWIRRRSKIINKVIFDWVYELEYNLKIEIQCHCN